MWIENLKGKLLERVGHKAVSLNLGVSKYGCLVTVTNANRFRKGILSLSIFFEGLFLSKEAVMRRPRYMSFVIATLFIFLCSSVLRRKYCIFKS